MQYDNVHIMQKIVI